VTINGDMPVDEVTAAILKQIDGRACGVASGNESKGT